MAMTKLLNIYMPLLYPDVFPNGPLTDEQVQEIVAGEVVADADFPITVSDYTGNEVTFEAVPDMLVCLNTNCVGAMAFIGTSPQAVADFPFLQTVFDPQFFEQPNEVELVGVEGFSPNFEEIVALAPDMVMTNGGDEQIEALSGLVPIYNPNSSTATLDDFFYDTRNLARIYGLEAETEEKIDALLDRAKAYGVASRRSKEIYFISYEGDGSFWINDGGVQCGFVQPEGSCSSEGNWQQVSVEGLLEIDPDVGLLRTEDEEGLAELQDNPLWQELSAVQNGLMLVIELDSAINHGADTPHTFRLWLDEVMPLAYPDIFPDGPLTDEEVQGILAEGVVVAATATYSPQQRDRDPARLSRVVLVGLLFLLALCSTGVLALMIGITQIAPSEVLTILFTAGGERVPRIVIWDVRLPRFVLGALAGAALAVSGAMLQDALKNELAEPGLLGVSTGASLVVAVVVIFNVPIPFGARPLFALAGGLGAGLVILLATRLTRDPVHMILIGAAMEALLGALITMVVVLGEPDELRALYSWLVGSLIGRDWEDVHLALPWIAVALPIALLFGRPLNLLQLGDDMAEVLGLPVFRTRGIIFTIAITLVAAIVAVCGPIGFVALVGPHMVRGMLQTSDARQALPVSALLGALLLTASDLLAREIFSPAELPVGLVTVALGSPIALVLLRRLIAKRSNV